MGTNTSVAASNEYQQIVPLLARLDRSELDRNSFTGSQVGDSGSLSLLVQRQASVEWRAASKSFRKGFDYQCALARLTIGTIVDVESVQVDIAAFGAMQVVCAQDVEIPREDRLEVAIGAIWEIQKARVEIHQGRWVSIAGARQAQHQTDACHRCAGEILTVVVIPSIVRREHSQGVLVVRVDSNSPTATCSILNRQSATRQRGESSKSHRQTTARSLDELYPYRLSPQRECFANTSLLLFGNCVRLGKSCNGAVGIAEVIVDSAYTIEIVAGERWVDVILKRFWDVSSSRIVVRTN